MIIELHPRFKKYYKKRIVHNAKLVKQTKKRIALFQSNPHCPLLKNHSLSGKKTDLRAFSITGNIRIVYFPVSKNHVLFLDIGTHNQVY
ncbi:MAG: type II toxin-antitoxin system mRNA interferase toxin, RelE/StbE family [bacterium]